MNPSFLAPKSIPDEARGRVVPVEFTVVDSLEAESRGEVLVSGGRKAKAHSTMPQATA